MIIIYFIVKKFNIYYQKKLKNLLIILKRAKSQIKKDQNVCHALKKS